MNKDNDFKEFLEGGEVPEDNLHYEKIEPVLLDDLLSMCYVVAVISHPEYLEMIFRNLQDQTLYHSLHIFNPAYIEMTSWRAGENGTKYIIKNPGK